MVGARTAVLRVPFAILQWLTGTILDAKWTGLASGGGRIYPEAGYRTAFGVCLGWRPSRPCRRSS